MSHNNLDNQIPDVFERLAEREPNLTSELMELLKRTDIATFQRLFGDAQVSPNVTGGEPMAPSPAIAVEQAGIYRRYQTDEELAAEEAERERALQFGRSRPRPSPPDWSKGEGWTG
jgi:hypothetical protein